MLRVRELVFPEKSPQITVQYKVGNPETYNL